MTARVRPRLLLRVLTAGLVVPALLIFGVLFSVNVLFPLLFPSGVSLTTAAMLVGGAVVAYYIFAFVSELDLLSEFFAWIVGLRWSYLVERGGVLGYLFYVSGQESERP